MSAFLRLSKYILLPIYNEWLDVIDFCHTDTAVCNQLERRQFLNLIGHECVKFLGLSEDAVCTKYLKWIASRNLRITHLIVEKQLLVRIFNKCLPVFVNLKYLEVSNYDAGFSVRLRQLLCVCTQLESFSLSTPKFLPCEIFETLSENCKKLRSITLEQMSYSSYVNLSDELVRLTKSCSCLTAVKLSNLVDLSGTFVDALISNCRLTELSIKNIPLLTAEQLDMLIDYNPDLTGISIMDCKLINVNNVMRILVKCSKLKTISVRTNNGQFFNNVDALINAVHITTLKLCSLRVPDKFLEMLSVDCSKLLILELTNQYAVTKSGFMNFASHCRHLTELSLAFCNGVTDCIIVEIANWKLIRLNLNGCGLLTDVSLQHIISKCHNLTSLSIGGNFYYTLSVEVYTNLLNACPRLSFLNVSYTYYATYVSKSIGEVVVAKYERNRKVPNELFTEAIKPDTALKELRFKGMKIRQSTLTMLRDTHKTLKVIHRMTRCRSMQYNSEDCN